MEEEVVEVEQVGCSSWEKLRVRRRVNGSSCLLTWTPWQTQIPLGGRRDGMEAASKDTRSFWCREDLKQTTCIYGP